MENNLSVDLIEHVFDLVNIRCCSCNKKLTIKYLFFYKKEKMNDKLIYYCSKKCYDYIQLYIYHTNY